MNRNSKFYKIIKKNTPVSIIASLVIILMITLYIKQPNIIELFDHKIYDVLLTTKKTKQVSPIPIVVDLDDETLARYGQWPWPRHLLAKLTQKLADKGVAAIGLDILLIEPDRTSPHKIQEDLKQNLDIDIAFTGLPEKLVDYDVFFANILEKAPAVLGMYFQFNTSPTNFQNLLPPIGNSIQKTKDAITIEQKILKSTEATLPLAIYLPSAPVGSINMSPDTDGIVRRVPLVTMFDGKFYPSLSLRTLMVAFNTKTLHLKVGADGLESIRIAKLTIPVTPEGNIIVPFQGPQKTHTYYSAKDVLDETIDQEKLQGRIVFLGTSAAGLNDIRATPFDRMYPGVEVHAAITNAILSNLYIKTPPWAPGVQVISITLCGLIAALAFAFARPKIYIFAGAALLGAAIATSQYFFNNGIFISPLYVLITIVAQSVLVLMLRFWQEETQKIVLRNSFSRYVAPEIVKRITELSGDIFAGEERNVSIMFTDVRKFTSISEHLTPQQVVNLLNRYFTPMTALVRGHSGTLDKFIGDALMAFWNAPLDVPNHPVLAVETALLMQEKLIELNETLKVEFGQTMNMGVGVHTGKAYVGNMGSEELLNYTLIGDNVNLTSRLEGLCSQYGVGIVISKETAEACGEHFAFQYLDLLRVKGRSQPVEVFVPMRHEEWQSRSEEMALYKIAQEAYAQANFAEATKHFISLQQQNKNNGLYQVYAERTAMLASSPPATWDGVWTLENK